jgi:hypothetical protein
MPERKLIIVLSDVSPKMSQACAVDATTVFTTKNGPEAGAIRRNY